MATIPDPSAMHMKPEWRVRAWLRESVETKPQIISEILGRGKAVELKTETKRSRPNGKLG